MVNIYKLTAPLVAAGLIVSGCASAHRPEAPASETVAVDYSCEPALDTNWVKGMAPDYVVAARAKSWEVTKVQTGQLTVTYFRDCGVDVRGPVSDRYRLGPLLVAAFCHVDKYSAPIRVGRDSLSADIDPQLIAEADRFLSKLRQSTNCTDKHITLVM